MGSNERQKGNSRAARLEAELRANLKKRKDQARARARVGASDPDGPGAQKDDAEAKGSD